MRYLTRLNVLGSLASLGVLIALSLLYASGNFYTVDSPLNLPSAPASALPEVHELAPPLTNSSLSSRPENRLIVFGDAWSDTASRLAEQGRAWPEWFCMMVSKRSRAQG